MVQKWSMPKGSDYELSSSSFTWIVNENQKIVFNSISSNQVYLPSGPSQGFPIQRDIYLGIVVVVVVIMNLHLLPLTLIPQHIRTSKANLYPMFSQKVHIQRRARQLEIMELK
jgi:hypothetical protein